MRPPLSSLWSVSLVLRCLWRRAAALGHRGTCALALLSCLAACSASKPRVEVARPAPPPGVIEKLSAGSTLVVARPTPGVARIALWFDAGSRDGSVPQLAIASAYWAEEQTGATARVLPDGTELTVLCDTRSRGVAACVTQLARAFALAAPSARDAELLRSRLRLARARAHADSGRDADELAFGALFGREAPQLFPFGLEGDDAKVDAGALQRFTSEHYLPSRALLIAAGDANEADVARAFASAASRARGVAKARNSATPPLSSGVRVAVGPTPWLSFVLAAPSSDTAAALAFGMRGLYPQASARIMSVRGARLLHVRMPGGDRPLRRLQRAVFDLRRLAIEASAKQARKPEESLENLTRLAGEEWAARGPVVLPATPWPLGVGVVIGSDATGEELAKKLQGLAKEAEVAVAAGERNSRGETTGSLEAHASQVATDNGAQIQVRRRAGDAWMSAVVRFAGGSELDSLTRHGRSALLATLMTDACRFTGAEGLDARLIELGVRLQPLVSPTHVGLLVSAPSERWREALDTVIRCALGPTLTSRALDDARLKLLRRLWGDSELRLLSALGHLLTPTAPGSVAPWGSPQAIASVHINEIRRLHNELLAGKRISVLAVTDAETDRVTRFIARRLSQLPPGEPAARVLVPAPDGLRGELTERGPLRAVVGLRVHERGGDPLVARVFASTLAELLSKRGLSVIGAWGDSSSELLLGGLAVAPREQSLGTLDRSVREALNELQQLPDEAIAQKLVRANLERSARSSSSADYARFFFQDQLTPPLPEQQLSSFKKLSQTAPAFFVLRPAP